ncbi:flippase [Limosilactobacillus sp. BG-MG3-A]|uniref:Flippase n=1 Tax=Limosilactobacillus agrestis TaxID=2759748 RepID=A0A7W3UFZ0_9LACO|nr:flippase [Limosilactobacillus agrestis]MBB1094879.1 flippase [Limosilactobacillus agrestis]
MKKNNFKIHSVKYNFIMNIILRTSQFIFPLVTFPYVSRILGAAPNGQISFATSVITYFMLLASLGIPTYGIRKCAEVRDSTFELSKTVQELVIINMLFTLLSYILLVIFIIIIPKFRENAFLLFICSFSIILNTIGVDWFYQGIEQYDYITVRNIVFKLLALVLMFLFVHKPSDYLVYAGIMTFGNAGSNILNLVKLKEYIIFEKLKRYELQKHMRAIFTLFLYSSATMIYTNLDQVMLGFMSSNSEVGYYAATVKIKNILVNLITALGAVMLPRIAYYLKKNNMSRFRELISDSFNFIFVMAVPLAFFFIVESRPIILFLAGDGYKNAVSIMQVIAPSIIFIGLGSVTAWQMLIPMKLEKYTVIAAILGAFVNLIINFLLIPGFGGIGAALGTDIAEIVVFFTQYYFLRDKIKGLLKSKEIIITLLGGGIASIVLIILNDYLSTLNIIIQCLIGFSAFTLCYLVALVTLREPTLKKYLNRV